MRGSLLLIGAVGFAVLGASCGGDTPEATPEPRGPEASPPAPFTLVGVPTGFELRMVSEGAREPEWSSDSSGGAHPVVVLVPDEWNGVDDRRWILVETYDGSGNQGGARQEIPTYQTPELEQVRTINGRSAVTAQSGRRARQSTAAFVAVDTSGSQGSVFGSGDHGFMVSGPGSSDTDTLVQIAGSVRGAAIHEPVVVDPPRGWRVLASLQGEQVGGFSPREGPDGIRGRRMITLQSTDHPWLTGITSVSGDADTAAAIAIVTSWRVHAPDDDRRIRRHESRAGTWFSVDDQTGIYASVGGKPFVLAANGGAVSHAVLAGLLDHIVFTDEPRWQRSLRTVTAPWNDPRTTTSPQFQSTATAAMATTTSTTAAP